LQRIANRMNDIRAIFSAIMRTLGVLMGHIGTLFLAFHRALPLAGTRRAGGTPGAVFPRPLHCAPFQNNWTQTQVAASKGLRANLLDAIAFTAPGQNQGQKAALSQNAVLRPCEALSVRFRPAKQLQEPHPSPAAAGRSSVCRTRRRRLWGGSARGRSPFARIRWPLADRLRSNGARCLRANK